jgi:membrane-associated PAP2 superfamily phosphatase
VILLAVVIAVFEILPIDVWLQDHLYNFTTHKWLIDSKDAIPRLLFYTGPKRLLLMTGLLLGIACFLPLRIRQRYLPDDGSRRQWLVVLATLASAPLLISSLKAITHVFCPYELVRYGGREDYQPTFKRYVKEDRPGRFGRGFPAGHASGGFALLSLAGLGASRRLRAWGLTIGLSAGTLMGGYQILKGAHFLSHTIVTALVCWLVFLGWHHLVVASRAAEKKEDGSLLPAYPGGSIPRRSASIEM